MVKDLYSSVKSALLNGGTEDADFEAKVICEEIFGRDFLGKLFSGQLERSVTDGEAKTASEMLQRRLSGEPLQYIIGHWEFYGEDFSVGEGVLIPRQDTETLVDAAMNAIKPLSRPVIMDLCSGSGCIAITLERLIKNSGRCGEIYAAELSDIAYSYLERNITARSSGARAVKCDVLHSESADMFGFDRFDLIVCNPPYLTSEDMRNPQREVTHEPETALCGGDDGLRFYREIPSIWRHTLKAGGTLAFEIGCEQAGTVSELLGQSGYENIEVIPDLCGKNRCVLAKNPL